MKKTTQTNWFLRSRLVIIPVISLYISYLIKELLKNIICIFDYNLIEVDKLVLILNENLKNNRFYYTKLTKLINWKIKNFLSRFNNILQTILLIY